MKNIQKILVGVLLCLYYNLSLAKNIEYSNRYYIYQSSGTSISWNDPEKANIISGSADFVDFSTNTRIVLGIDLGKKYCYSQYNRFEVQTQINYTYINNPTSGSITTGTNSVTKTFSIDYDPNNTMSYKEMDILYLDNVYEIEVKTLLIRAYDINGNVINYTIPTTFPEDVYLELITQHERYYDFDINAYTTGILTSHIATENKIELKWGPMDGAEFYDIEWTYANDYGTSTLVGGTLPTSQIPLTFKNNAARVRVPADAYGNNQYLIPNVFDRGYIVFRIRGVARGGIDYQDEIPGTWSLLNNNGSTTLNTIMPACSCYYYNSNSTLPFINWKGNISYAEDGKSKYVVSYADGSGRVRQAVTLSSTTNLAIITETIYDHQGRPAIQTLPVPANTAVIQYYTDFNRSASTGQKYNVTDFDLDPSSAACVDMPGAMSDISGSEWYYSPNNNLPMKEILPKAKGYPFTITQYERDNTGRVRREGGVGVYHTLGSSHETEYFYGTPPQELLDRLFGTDVGYSKFYKMNMVQDANGQVSVSYLDMAGRTIATALAGDSPVNLIPLEDNAGNPLESTAAENMSIDLLNKSTLTPNGENNVFSQDSLQLTTSAQILVTADGLNTFHYSVKRNTITDTCLTACFDPVYDLEIGLLDACSNNLLNLPSGQNVFKYRFGGLPVDTLCNDTAIFNTDDQHLGVFTIPNMPVGVYSLTKKLTLNDSAFNQYWDFYIAQNTCLKTVDDFYQEPDTSGCDITCAQCEAELAALGSKSDYINANKHNFTDQAEAVRILGESYDQKVQNCEFLCTDPGLDICNAGYEMLLNDMRPGGQYARFAVDSITGINYVSYSLHPLSIFLTPSGNSAPRILPYRMLGLATMTPSWKNPYYENGTYKVRDYVDDNDSIIWVQLSMDAYNNYVPAVDNLDSIVVDSINFTAYTKIKNLKNLTDFIGYYSQYPSLAKSLIFYHPEYYSYKWCKTNSYSTSAFQGKQINTWQFDGKLAEMNVTTAITEFGSSMNLIAKDPFFIQNGSSSFCNTGSSFTVAMQQKMNNYIQIGGTPFSIFEFAYITNYCGSPSNQTIADITSCLASLGATSNQDYLVNQDVWNTFFSYYTSAKQDLLFKAQDCYSNSNTNQYSNTTCINNSSYVAAGINNSTQNIYNPCNGYNFYIYAGKVKRYANHDNALNLLSSTDSTYLQQLADQQYFASTGICPVLRDVLSMLNQLARKNNLTNTVNLANGQYLSGILYNILSPSNNIWNPVVTNSNTTITWTMSGYSCPLTLNFPSHPDNLNFTQVHHFISVRNVATAGGVTTFLMDVQVLNPITNLMETVSVSGSICMDVTSCQNDFLALCEVNSETKDLGNLVNYLITQSIFNASSPTALSTPVYDYLITPRLQTYLQSNGSYTWMYNTSSSRYELQNTSTSSTIYLSVSNTGGVNLSNPFVVLGYEPVNTTSSSPSSPSTVRWKVYQGGSPYDGTQAANFTMTVNITTTSGLAFQSVSCNFATPVECDNPENRNREELQTILQNSISGPPDSTCFDSLRYQNSSSPLNFDIWRIQGSVEADMSKAFDAVNSYWFKIPVINTMDGTRDTLIGRYCQPIANCSACDEPCEQPDTITLSFAFGKGTPANRLIKIQVDNQCLSIEKNYPGTIPTAWVSAWANEINNNVNGVTATANGIVLTLRIVKDSAFKQECNCLGAYRFYSLAINESVTPNTVDTLQILPQIPCCAPVPTPGAKAVASAMNAGPWEEPDSLKLPTECNPYIAPFPPGPEYQNPCAQQLKDIAMMNAQNAYQAYLDSIKTGFRRKYIREAMDVEENFIRDYREAQYHYTLYYYDQGANLVRTVPPKAVTPLPLTDLPSVRNARDNKLAPVIPEHAQSGTPEFLLCSDYRFNSLDQPIVERSPDGGVSKFWYDELGRIVFSQNAKQSAEGEAAGNLRYSYTFYDGQGRIVEVGQLTNDFSLTQQIADNLTLRKAWLLNTFDYEEVTRTFYDNQPFTAAGFVQRNLRNRVAAVTYVNTRNSDSTVYQTATHYSYDIHGNVNRLWQENRNMPVSAQRIKQIQYYYDLVSGNVNGVAYQPGEIDAFYHQYRYDADNRLTEVYTIDGLHAPLLKTATTTWAQIRMPFAMNITPWSYDGNYQYYFHGPLLLSGVPKNSVHVNYYVYTLQGWIKGLNTETLDPIKNPFNSTFRPDIGRESFSYYLDYYQNDYEPVGGGAMQYYASRNALYTNGDIISLYNGNIAAMSTTIRNPNTMTAQPLLGRFRYDQLNRIIGGDYYNDLNVSTNAWSITSTDDYKNSYKYDPNGNITHLMRNGTQNMGLEMDELTYHYKANTNQLLYIEDAVTSSPYPDDLRNQDPDNYAYDEIGNLIQDLYEGIDVISWNLYGKVKSMARAGTRSQLSYFYNPNGQRVQKNVIFTDSIASTYYVHDASGNMMASYKYTGNSISGKTEFYPEQFIMYGSSRLGVKNSEKLDLQNAATIKAELIAQQMGYSKLGDKQYEFSDHLGNVHMTISDRNKRNCDEEGAWQYNDPDILTSTDYYPGGYQMPERKWNTPRTYITPKIITTDYYDDFRQGTITTTPGINWMHNWRDSQPHCTMSTATIGGEQWLKIENANTSYGIYKDFAVAPGITYTITYTIDMGTEDRVNMLWWERDSSGSFGSWSLGSPSAYASGTHTIVLTPTKEILRLQFRCNATGRYFYMRDVSISHVVSNGGLIINDTAHYAFGYNNQLKDNEIYGEGNAYDYGARMYDSRVVRFMSVDKLTQDYPGLTPYQFASNTPIMAIDIDGLECYVAIFASEPPNKDGHAYLIVANFEKTGTTNKQGQDLYIKTGYTAYSNPGYPINGTKFGKGENNISKASMTPDGAKSLLDKLDSYVKITNKAHYLSTKLYTEKEIEKEQQIHQQVKKMADETNKAFGYVNGTLNCTEFVALSLSTLYDSVDKKRPLGATKINLPANKKEYPSMFFNPNQLLLDLKELSKDPQNEIKIPSFNENKVNIENFKERIKPDLSK